MPGEFDFIDWIRAQHKPHLLVQLPSGDDLAILDWPANQLLLVGVDQVLDGVHFDSTVHAPRLIGRKVMNRNLSDCAAMGCLPAAAVATVALPLSATMEFAQQLYLGLRDAADPFDCPIVGGDTASWPGKLAMTLTILGRDAGVPPITRSGAQAGDALYVTGPLGGSILGRHMTFQPRITLGRQIAESRLATSMIDLSDGLSRDLPHLCARSHLGAVIDAAAIPIHPDAITLSQRDNIPPLDHALHDGEDHELLFTSSSPKAAALPGVTRIGTMRPEPGIFLLRDNHLAPLQPRGWEHRLGHP